MWLFTKYGFYSAVCGLKAPEFKEIDPDLMIVRARSRNHLANLIERFPLIDRNIEETPERDYRFRIVISKVLWKKVVEKLTAEMNYDNFKDEAHELGDQIYDRALHEVWSVMWCVQQRRLKQ